MTTKSTNTNLFPGLADVMADVEQLTNEGAGPLSSQQISAALLYLARANGLFLTETLDVFWVQSKYPDVRKAGALKILENMSVIGCRDAVDIDILEDELIAAAGRAGVDLSGDADTLDPRSGEALLASAAANARAFH